MIQVLPLNGRTNRYSKTGPKTRLRPVFRTGTPHRRRARKSNANCPPSSIAPRLNGRFSRRVASASQGRPDREMPPARPSAAQK